MEAQKKLWQCQMTSCGYIYNWEKGDKKGKIPAGTSFESLSESWRCPLCGVSKKKFKEI